MMTWRSLSVLVALLLSSHPYNNKQLIQYMYLLKITPLCFKKNLRQSCRYFQSDKISLKNKIYEKLKLKAKTKLFVRFASHLIQIPLTCTDKFYYQKIKISFLNTCIWRIFFTNFYLVKLQS